MPDLAPAFAHVNPVEPQRERIGHFGLGGEQPEPGKKRFSEFHDGLLDAYIVNVPLNRGRTMAKTGWKSEERRRFGNNAFRVPLA
ncbi:hypothetical protein GC209_05640 [bacterium]|nr:hypothetical protein [bacterium]